MFHVIDVTAPSLYNVYQGLERGAGARPWNASGCIAETEVVEPVTQAQAGVAPPGPLVD